MALQLQLQLQHLVLVLIIVVLSFSCCCGGIDEQIVGRKMANGHGHISAIRTRRALGTSRKIFNVHDFGAKGNGVADDTQAFVKAWKKTCSTSGATMLVPSNKKYHLKPITFSGPCHSKTTIQIQGTILASNDRSDYKKDSRHWLLFERVQNLVVEGHGLINGNGKIWWRNSCKINKRLPCKDAPTALTFYGCKNLIVRNLKIQNAQQIHISFEKCVKVRVLSLKVTAPVDSPNTDGIHISRTKNIIVSKTIIGTGDDCISIEKGTHTVRAFDITCGPGHGISIGSLGDDNSEAHVSDIIVNGAILSGTTNGLRIKTWQGGSGVARNIKFLNINMYNVKNPIIINQNYCDQDKPCKKQDSAVQVRDVVYKNIRGTSSSEKAVIFDCSKNYPCKGIIMENVKIKSAAGGRKSSEATCNNVQLSRIESVSPQC